MAESTATPAPREAAEAATLPVRRALAREERSASDRSSSSCSSSRSRGGKQRHQGVVSRGNRRASSGAKGGKQRGKGHE